MNAVSWGRSLVLFRCSWREPPSPPRSRNLVADAVRTANDRFKDVAVAISEGYAPIPCASGVDGGAMGIHYVNAKLHRRDGRYQAPAERSCTTQARRQNGADRGRIHHDERTASLEGHLFNFNGAPNRYGLPPFYELHVWAWKANPRGPFADMNPKVSCEHAHR